MDEVIECYDFFISYSGEDLPVVGPIVERMENEYGAKCWIQKKQSYSDYAKNIIHAIDISNAMIVFVSPNSARSSSFVHQEVLYGLNKRKEDERFIILPIVIDPNLKALPYDEIYGTLNFRLSPFNMLFVSEYPSMEELVLKIFSQTNFDIEREEPAESCYHTSETEAKRLQAQNQILNSFSKDLIQSMIRPASIILDVGCSTGGYIMSILEGIEYEHLLGVDMDPEVIKSANAKFGSDKNTFCALSVPSDEFDDYLLEHDYEKFDIIHLSSVLLHQKEPVPFLKSLRKVLKKDGYLIIQDEDDGANLVYPPNRFYDLAFEIWKDSKESGDRNCARKIPQYLKSAGFNKVKLAKCGISNPGLLPEQTDPFWDIYFNYHLWLALEENVFYHPSTTGKLIKEYEEKYEECKLDYDNGETFIQYGFFLFLVQR